MKKIILVLAAASAFFLIGLAFFYFMFSGMFSSPKSNVTQLESYHIVKDGPSDKLNNNYSFSLRYAWEGLHGVATSGWGDSAPYPFDVFHMNKFKIEGVLTANGDHSGAEDIVLLYQKEILNSEISRDDDDPYIRTLHNKTVTDQLINETAPRRLYDAYLDNNTIILQCSFYSNFSFGDGVCDSSIKVLENDRIQYSIGGIVKEFKIKLLPGIHKGAFPWPTK